jgi:hypothetical protein
MEGLVAGRDAEDLFTSVIAQRKFEVRLTRKLSYERNSLRAGTKRPRKQNLTGLLIVGYRRKQPVGSEMKARTDRWRARPRCRDLQLGNPWVSDGPGQS